MDNLYTVGASSGTPFTAAAGSSDDNYMVATSGTVVLSGLPGDDILEDHNARALLIGGEGNDRLISRNGRDALWGGNTFGLLECQDTVIGTDRNANICSWYE